MPAALRLAPLVPIMLALALLASSSAWAQPPVMELPTARRILVVPRAGGGIDAQSFPAPDGTGQVAVITSGVRVIIQDVVAPSPLDELGTIELAADRVVIWGSGLSAVDLLAGQSTDAATPIEFYLEGNIVFRQGLSIVHADRMYYNVATDQGVILDAEVLTPAGEQAGMMRLKAEVVRRLSAERFEALEAAATTSRLGVPRYWLQAGNVQVVAPPQAIAPGPAGIPMPAVAPAESRTRLTSRNNLIYLGGWPIFYWPFLVTDLQRPSTVITGLRVNQDEVFGTQVQTRWNLYQLLGIPNPPTGTEWSLAVDHFTKRGTAFGTNFQYDVNSLLGRPVDAVGFLDAWFIQDEGLDVLGRTRMGLVPEEDFRGRVLGRHRQWFPRGYRLTGELGWISDRNFLEQYFESEFDEEKDLTTGAEFKRQIDNRAWSIVADARVNDFFTQTEWLPRADHFWLGQSLFAGRLTWYEHSSVGYARLKTASPPLDPIEQLRFDPLAWEVPQEGLRASTRQELNLPLAAGPVKLVPFILGEATYWNDDLQGESATRFLGQAGLRSSLPMWRINSQVQSELWNLNGLAHKVNLVGEVLVADATEPLTNLPLYDPIDDDAIEFFRRRFFFDTFGGVPGGNVALEFDERTFAYRSLVQRWVASPSTEIADDLAVVRLGAHHRWQTRRGLPGQQRIVDWIVLDTQGSFFPRSDRDNFGESLGLLRYNFRWHPGDRLAILSDGLMDLFDDGLRTISLGAVLTRPGRGSYFAGIRSIEGPISSHTLTTSSTYRLSPKWIINYGSSFDFGDTGNIGQFGSVVRVGESFLVSVGAHYDAGRDNFGVQLSIAPRFLPSDLGTIGGAPIPPAGHLGLE